jgi:hypothetical protein
MHERLYPSPVFNRLTNAVATAGGSVRLHRYEHCWGLHVVVGTDDDVDGARAAGFTFNDLNELEWHAGLLLPWLDQMYVDPSPGAGNAA